MNEYQLWFRSPLFRIEAGEDEETNPMCFGRHLAHWLGEQLEADGVPVEGVIPEDWGWCLVVRRRPFLLWVGCGNVQNDSKWRGPPPSLSDGKDVVWTCHVVAEVPLVKRLLRAPDTETQVKELFERVQRLVASAPGTAFVAEP